MANHQGISKAIQVLEDRKKTLREEYERDLTELNDAIEKLKSNPPISDGRVARGTMRGMSLPDSIHAFLLAQDGPVGFSALMEALTVGGVRLGDANKPNRYAANVKTTIVNNRKRFRYNKRRNTVQLLRQQETV